MREFYTFVSSRMWGIYFSPAPFPLSGSDLRFKLGYRASQLQQRRTEAEAEVSFLLMAFFHSGGKLLVSI